MNIDSVLQFCRLLMQFQAVERFGFEPPPGFRENDAEHSYSLAMMSWYIISTAHLDLSLDTAIRYALVHDLVEVYAGDTHAFDPETITHTKQLREDLALNLLRQSYPDFTDLPDLIHSYERRIDPEARFVYALDKLMPSLLIYHHNGRHWADRNITFANLQSYNDHKIALDPTIDQLWTELKSRLEARPELFGIQPN